MTLFLPMPLYYDLLNKARQEDLALLSMSIPYTSSGVDGVVIPRPFPDDMTLPASKIKIEGSPSAENKDIFEAVGYTLPPSAEMPVKVADLGQPAPAPGTIPVAEEGVQGKPVHPAADGCVLGDELRANIAQLEVLVSSLKGMLARMDKCQDE
jgi:hypothetical protein